MQRLLRSILIAGLLAGGGVFGAIASAHQESASIDLEQTAGRLVQFTISASGSGGYGLSVSRFTLRPGQSSIELTAGGATAIVPQSGSLLLAADRLVDGASTFGDGTAGVTLPEVDPSRAIDASGGTSAEEVSSGRNHLFVIAAGNAAIVDEGTVIRFIAREAQPVEVLLINLTPNLDGQ